MLDYTKRKILIEEIQSRLREEEEHYKGVAGKMTDEEIEEELKRLKLEN